MDNSDPDPNKFYECTVKIRVSALWVADGFDLTTERANRMLAKELGWANGSEFEAEVVSAPNADEVAVEMGYESDAHKREDKRLK